MSNHYRCRSAQLTKQVLLQDEKRLRGSTYTVGGERRVGPLFACRGRCLIGPRAAAGHPYGNESFSGVRPPWGNSTKGAEAPFWSFQGERVLRERGKFEIPLSLSGSLVTFCPHRKSLARRRNIPKTVLNLFRRADEDIGPYENAWNHTGGRPVVSSIFRKMVCRVWHE